MRDFEHRRGTPEECVPPARAAARQAPSDAAMPARSVLCVLPRADAQNGVREALPLYRTVFVSHALDAMRNLNAQVFDAYILDYWIGDWSGAQLCRHIRRSDPHGPIIFYTATGTEDQRKRAMRAGAQAFVCVSAGPDALRDELTLLLNATDRRSAEARGEIGRVIEAELTRLATLAMARDGLAWQSAAAAVERVARTRAQVAFFASGGSLARFERWWPQSFSTAAAAHELSEPSASIAGRANNASAA